ncbi:hypothetical protein GPECTOR_7g1286 [Gonium pectorale]|uniref:D-aminoacyl-tRNA deacylase n=1 Tax=Gonium pectorale TaxID=33097 RepID=A0A150GVL6_GONPE|nr:hypothetical protein GPECTOR_7g1286 [Gonium pectorale]|eukprot:KXZ53390.1 hypothetical protein GPECTOR_7g1286 [Gonium pectorale]
MRVHDLPGGGACQPFYRVLRDLGPAAEAAAARGAPAADEEAGGDRGGGSAVWRPSGPGSRLRGLHSRLRGNEMYVAHVNIQALVPQRRRPQQPQAQAQQTHPAGPSDPRVGPSAPQQAEPQPQRVPPACPEAHGEGAEAEESGGGGQAAGGEAAAGGSGGGGSGGGASLSSLLAELGGGRQTAETPAEAAAAAGVRLPAGATAVFVPWEMEVRHPELGRYFGSKLPGEPSAKKILTVRAWPHPETNRAWDTNVKDAGREILLVSQFTLYARLKKPKPDYSKAMGPQQARELYDQLVEEVRRQYDAGRVKDGVFGAMMDVALVNEGPVTYVVDSNDPDG